jgi:hypothetical protein
MSGQAILKREFTETGKIGQAILMSGSLMIKGVFIEIEKTGKVRLYSTEAS